MIYASSGGQLKISRDRGRTFTPIGDLKDSLSGEIAINPSDPSLMLVGTRSGQCRLSRDAGLTWTACSGSAGPSDRLPFRPHQQRPHHVRRHG